MTDTGSGRPVVGITTYVEPVNRAAWVDQHSAVLPYEYVTKVERAGGLAVLIPPRADADDALAHEYLDRLDGLIIAGGADVAPEHYGQQRHPSLQASRPDRDTMEFALARASYAADLPTLGICRGMQVMAVVAGGQLEQHLPDRVGHDGHSPYSAAYGWHAVETVAGTRIGTLLGERVEVPSLHHQAVTTHPGYVPAAWAPDGTLEAMEDPDAFFRVAVQWHPEAGDDPRLFDALVAAAVRRRA